jgi:sugar lactone lactonase YvrE
MKRRTAAVLTVMLACSGLASAQIGYIYTYAGNPNGSFPGDGGPATNAIITNPGGLAIDNVGNLLIAASGNSLIRLVNASTGIITTVAGGGTGGDGGLATSAQLASPCDMKLDPWGNLYISETCESAAAGSGGGGGGGSGTGGIARIRRVDASTGIITTVAGGATSGFAGDGGPAASALLNTPVGLAIDSSGNIFIADLGNNRIRRIDYSSGIISTVAGNGVAAFAGDGGLATSASLNSPTGVAVDASGNLYIADMLNNAIRRVDGATGIITTVAGTGTAGFNGDGIPATTATLFQPANLILYSGNLIFSDLSNDRVRTIDNSGIVWTIAGNGSASASGGQIGDGAPASQAVLSHPFGLAARPSEPLFIAELTGNRVREDGIPNNIAATAVTVSSTPATVGLGGTVTLTATLAASNGQASSASGGVYFFDGSSTVIGSAALVNGAASMTTSSLALGVHNISAQYIPSGGFGGSVSPVFVLTVSAAVPAVSFWTSPNPATANQPVALNVSISPSSATGTVTFYNGSTALGSATLSGGAATLTVAFPTSGGYSLTAQYGGDASHSAAVSPVVSLTVKSGSSITVTSSMNPSTSGQSVTFNAAIVPATATATLVFLDGGLQIGAATIVSGAASFSTSTLTIGQHSITVTYSGDANDSSALSAPLTQTVAKTGTTATLISSLNPAPSGSAVTFYVTVSPAAATGTVQVLDGATVLGTITLASGAASFITSSLTPGGHSITAVYSGDTVYAGSTSPAVAQTVTGPTAVALTSNQNPVPVGAPVILTAAVSPATATGTVQFLDGGTVLSTVTLASGSASFTTTALAQGTHYFTAVYSGEANNSSSSSAPLPEVVKLVTAMTLSSSLNPLFAGQAVTFNSTVNPAATGTIQFLDGSTVLATMTISSGAASYSTSTLAEGTHSIGVIYSGDANYMSAQSATMSQTVNAKATTSTTVTSGQNPAYVSAMVTFTATVSPSTATGTVQFLDGATVLGTGTLANGSASFSTSTLAQGAHSITAVYSGDAGNTGSTSAVLSQVMKVSAGMTVGLSPSPAVVGQTLAITANLPVAATGTVQFTDGATVLATVPVSGGSASYSTTTLAQGSHTLGVAYSGDATYVSQSATVPETVLAASTVALVSNVNPSLVGQSVTFTASVTPSSATGTVQFFDGGTLIGTASVASGAASFATASLAKVGHSITATYGGDASDAAASSGTLNQVVTASTSVGLTSSLNPSTPGQAVTFTASITPSMATGTVQFLDGSTVLGTVSVSSGSAALSTSSLAVGAHSITAAYRGDATYNPSNSAALQETVTKTVTTTVLSASPSPSTAGQSVTLTAAVSPSAATGTVQFYNGATSLGTASVTNGQAQWTTAALPAGTNSLTASYSGDANNAASTSAAISQTVNKIATGTTITTNPAFPTVGQTVNIVAAVSPTTATGAVNFFSGSTLLGTSNLSNGQATFPIQATTAGLTLVNLGAVYQGDSSYSGSSSPVISVNVGKGSTTTALSSSVNPSVHGQAVTFTAAVTPAAATGTVTFSGVGTASLANGVASITTSALPTGTTTVSAQYNGDSNYNSSASAGLAQVVKAATTTSLTSSPNPSNFGQTVTLTATVTPSSATGSVQFFNGGTLLGTGTMSSGHATLSGNNLPAGSLSLTAVYSGDANHAPSTSTAHTQTVNKANSNTMLTASPSSATVGQSVTFTATVSPASGTGTVEFTDNGTVLATITVGAGTAVFSTSSLASGNHPMKAIYSGDANVNSSQSSTLNYKVH